MHRKDPIPYTGRNAGLPVVDGRSRIVGLRRISRRCRCPSARRWERYEAHQYKLQKAAQDWREALSEVDG